MKEYLKRIWSGEVCPVETCALNNRQIIHLEDLRERNRIKLADKLNDEEKEIFDKYIDCVDELIYIYLEEAFVSGVRYTSQFMIEALA